LTGGTSQGGEMPDHPCFMNNVWKAAKAAKRQFCPDRHNKLQSAMETYTNHEIHHGVFVWTAACETTVYLQQI